MWELIVDMMVFMCARVLSCEVNGEGEIMLFAGIGSRRGNLPKADQSREEGTWGNK